MISDEKSSRVHRILGVGIATLDVINEVSGYPAEDEEVRALGHRVRRGGNATNTLVVLAQLGHHCFWAGTLGDDPQSGEILSDLERYGVDTALCVRHTGGRTPTSYVTLSHTTGSRTIVHYRDLPELRAADIAGLNAVNFDWVHFEGRNTEETALMLDEMSARCPGLPISLEVEKQRPGIERLLRGPRVVLFSQAYARSRGYSDPESFLAGQWARTSAELLILPWGADGAYGQSRGGSLSFARAYVPAQTIDTLGAGDVFTAAVIDGLLAGLELQVVLERSNQLAGHKCGLRGLDGLDASTRGEGNAPLMLPR